VRARATLLHSPPEHLELRDGPNDANVVRGRSFEVFCVSDQMEKEEEEENTPETPQRQRPLLAVDFGHAVWLEHVRPADDEDEGGAR